MAEPAAKLWTLDEFLAYDDGKGTRHELFDGEIVAMAPATRAHAVLSARLVQLYEGALPAGSAA
jgi:Uma2 family endonuclease